MWSTEQMDAFLPAIAGKPGLTTVIVADTTDSPRFTEAEAIALAVAIQQRADRLGVPEDTCVEGSSTCRWQRSLRSPRHRPEGFDAAIKVGSKRRQASS